MERRSEIEDEISTILEDEEGLLSLTDEEAAPQEVFPEFTIDLGEEEIPSHTLYEDSGKDGDCLEAIDYLNSQNRRYQE
jgi:hypothetical protein